MSPATLISGNRRKSSRRLRPERLISHVRELAQSLISCTKTELRDETENVRRAFLSSVTHESPELLIAGAALAAEAVRRGHGVNLYEVQLLAVIHLAQGKVVQMQTGEGKTFVAIATAAIAALCGSGVHVMTPNAYLAERDRDKAKQALVHLGMTVGLTPERGETADKQKAYDCDVTYGTGHEFGFDYLRDQLTLRKEANARLGTKILDDLRADASRTRQTMQRGLVFAIVDEADSVMFDDAASPLVLSISAPGTAPDLEAHLMAKNLADELQEGSDYQLNESTGQLRLTSDGANMCYSEAVSVPGHVLLRPWTAYVEQALRAKYLFRRDIHYIVGDDEVRIVDQTTGRIFEDRSWQDGLHQAIEAREGLPVTPEKESLARITRQRFFRLYKNLCGMTGTAIGCEKEFAHVYRRQVQDIPLNRPSARTLFPTRFFSTREAKLNAIVDDVVRRRASGQPVLIGTQSIQDSDTLAEKFSLREVPFELLNGLQTKEEADIIARAGEVAEVTIATNLAGRGTDILVPPESEELGGLHVVVAECQLSGRMDRQLVGRAGRQGQKGAAQMFVSADDALVVRFGSWLGEAIRREAGNGTEADVDFSSPLLKLQKAAEKQQFLARAELLRQDIATDSLFGINSQ